MKQLNLNDDEPEGCVMSAAKRVIIAALLTLLLVAPCNMATRTTSFTIDGTVYPAKCLDNGQRTLGCRVYAE